MPLFILPSSGGASVPEDFEAAVRRVLGETDEHVTVRIGACPADDGRTRYVCKVETPPSSPFGAETQWRWWSPLHDTPEEMAAALREAVTRRRRAAAVPPEAANRRPAVRA